MCLVLFMHWGQKGHWALSKDGSRDAVIFWLLVRVQGSLGGHGEQSQKSQNSLSKGMNVWLWEAHTAKRTWGTQANWSSPPVADSSCLSSLKAMALRGRFLKTAHCPTTRAVCKLHPSVWLQNPSCFRGLHPASSIAGDIRGKMIWCEYAALDSCFRHCKSWPQGPRMDPIFLAENVTQGLLALSQKGMCDKKKWGSLCHFLSVWFGAMAPTSLCISLLTCEKQNDVVLGNFCDDLTDYTTRWQCLQQCLAPQCVHSAIRWANRLKADVSGPICW